MSLQVEAMKGGISYQPDYRFLALRGPLVIQGWGYDTNGKPIPNESDSDLNAVDGNFESTDLTNNFMDDWLRKSHCWPVAPVDLRYDRKRGVWTVPSAMRMLLVDVRTGIPVGNSASANVLNYGENYNDVGDLITNPLISLTNPLERTLETGRYTCYFDSHDCKYYPIGAGTSSSSLTITDAGCQCSLGGYLQDRKVSYLVVGTGLELVSSGCPGIAGLIDNPEGYTLQTNISIEGDNSCNQDEFERSRFETLIFGTGISIYRDSGEKCAYHVHAGTKVSRTSTYGISNISVSDNVASFAQLVVGSGISAYINGCLLTIGSDLRATDLWCGNYPGGFAEVPFTKLTFGQGLHAQNLNGDIQVSGGIWVDKTNIEASNTVGGQPYLIEKLRFGRGFALDSLGNCEILVSTTGNSGGSVLISNDGCSEPFTLEDISGLSINHFRFGSGIHVRNSGDGSFKIHAPMSVFKSKDQFVNNLELDRQTSVEHIVFGSGLSVDWEENSCRARVDTNMRLYSIDPCWQSDDIYDEIFYALHFSSGLSVDVAKDAFGNTLPGQYKVAAGGIVFKYDTEMAVGNILEADLGQVLSARPLTFMSGFAVQYDYDTCELMVSPDILIEKRATCGASEQPYKAMFRLSVGTGLDMTEHKTGYFKLDAPLWVKNETGEVEAVDNAPNEFKPYEKITFGKNVLVEAKENCELLISVPDAEQQQQNLFYVQDTACNGSIVDDIIHTAVTGLIFGVGLSLSPQGPDGMVVNGGLLVSDGSTTNREEKIVFSNCFTVNSSDCTSTIGLNQNPGYQPRVVTVLTDVRCEADGFVYSYARLTFNECGILTSILDPAPPP
jgi:hypothetical protein